MTVSSAGNDASGHAPVGPMRAFLENPRERAGEPEPIQSSFVVGLEHRPSRFRLRPRGGHRQHRGDRDTGEG